MTNFQTAILNLYQSISSTFEHIALLESFDALYNADKQTAIAEQWGSVTSFWNKIDEYSHSSLAEPNNYSQTKKLQYQIVHQISNFKNAERNLCPTHNNFYEDHYFNIKNNEQKSTFYEEDKVNHCNKIKELCAELAKIVDPSLYSEIVKPVYIFIPEFDKLYQTES